MTSIIEQADAIVGISDILGPGGALDYTPKETKDTHRRGAYARWFSESSLPDQWPTVAETIESQAERIVRLHKPKGDGLPDDATFSVLAEGFGDTSSPLSTSFQFSRPMSERERYALAAYFRRCLAPPVRRLLAMYDVVEEKPTCGRVNIPHVKVNAGMTQWHTEGDICWLVPRGER